MASLLVDNGFSAPTKMGIGAGASVGYTFMFGKAVGIHTGISASYTSSGFTAPEVYSLYRDDLTTYDNTGTYNGSGEIRVATANAEESYGALLLSVPIQLAYVHKLFWARMGVRIAFPMSISASYVYGASARSITHIYNTDTDLSGNPIPLSSDYTLKASDGSYTVASGLLVDLDIEAGYCIPRGRGNSIYVGVYIDYPLNSIATPDDSQFASFVAGGDFDTFNGALASSATSSFSAFSAGVKVSYNFLFGKNLK